MMRKNGIFPYGYMNDRSKFTASLPKQYECFDRLTNKLMDDKSYAKMENAYNHFDCESGGKMLMYMRIYLKNDCISLLDAVEDLTEKNIKEELLDLADYITFPQLSFDSMLRLTGVKLDLFPPDQEDMFNLFNDNRRGGFATCPKRYAKANHKYLINYNPTKLSVFIMAFDINGMYSSVRENELPKKDYQRMTEEELENWEKFFEIDGEGCFLVSDIDYPLELHNDHNSFPYLPDHLNGRLDAHLWNRRNFGLDYLYLKSAIDGGLELKKIHRGIRYKEEAFVREFIKNNNKNR